MIKKIMREMIINAVKYSPEGSNIDVYFNSQSRKLKDGFDIIVRNVAKESTTQGLDGAPVLGIPYEYSELVFDLLYTIDKYPHELDEEDWRNGTGLYIIREILKKESGGICVNNGVDYTKDHPVIVVTFYISLPYSDEDIEEEKDETDVDNVMLF